MEKKWSLKIIALMVCGMTWAAVPTYAETPTDENETRAAGGIRTDFGDVLIENLGIGRTYNLRDLAGTPLKITNTGEWTIDLRIDIEIPDKKMITQGRYEKGFRPIPSQDWVSLGRSQFIVPSGESAFTDVVITIPNDPELYGKKFQASIFSRSIDRRFLNLGVWSHILFTIVRSPEDQKKVEENRKRGVVENMDYTLIPDKIVILNAPYGRKMDIQKEINRTIKIANSGDKPIELRMKVVPVGSTPLTLQAGYEDPADLSWLTFKEEVFTVEASSFYDPGLILNLPKDKSLSKKKYMFVLRIEPADPHVIGVTYYGKIYAEVQ